MNKKSSRLIVFLRRVIYYTLGFLFVWYGVYCIWQCFNNYHLDHDGEEALATIIDKWDYITYDVEWEGKYYVSKIKVTKKVFRTIKVGEHFPALVLSKKLHRHRNSGITPSYIKIILQPLPDIFQDYDYELNRIDSLYHGNRPMIPQ